MVAKRYLFALDMDKTIDRVTSGCHTCAALQHSPNARIDQSTSPPPDVVGQSFAADVIKRSRQLILVLRETVTSYTVTRLLKDERHSSLRDTLIQLCIQLRPLDGPPAIIRTDPAPGFKALVDDKLLKQYRITIELGHSKNPNKNPVAEKAVQELEHELLRQDPLGGQATDLTLSIATASLNSRIRSRGLSAREMWTQRDQFSHRQLPLNDDCLLTIQHKQRLKNHPFSEFSKAPTSLPHSVQPITVGNLVYLHTDRNKSRARDSYLVSIENPFCSIKKFVGNQLRSSSYRVKLSDSFKVPADTTFNQDSPICVTDEDTEVEIPIKRSSPPCPPPIPTAISTPVTQRRQSETHQCSSPAEPNTTEDTNEADAPSSVPSVSQEGLRRSTRLRRTPAHLADYITDI